MFEQERAREKESGIGERETKKRERERERKKREVGGPGGFPSQKQNCHKIHTTNAANINSEIEQGRESPSVMTIFVYGIKLYVAMQPNDAEVHPLQDMLRCDQ